MNARNSFKIKKLVGFMGGLMLLPVLAACGPETAQAPTDPTPAAPQAADPQTTAPQATAPQTTGAGTDTIFDVAAKSDSFNTLTTAVQAAGLTETLQQQQPLTIFAPTDEAFAALPEGTLERLLQPENRELLTRVLTYHAVPGEVNSNQLQAGRVQTVEGNSVDIQVDTAANEVTVNEAMVIQPDIQASNGVIHGVNEVLLPPDINL